MSIDFDIKKIKVANKKWCPEVESNHRHKDFQSFALPTELSGHEAVRNYNRTVRTGE